MNEEVLNLLLNIGAASLVPMAGGIAAYVVQKLKMGALDLNTKRWEQTQLTINAAIKSAEQAGKVGTLATSGDKKKHAMELAKSLLAKQKIKVDEAVLSELIEANVWETKNSKTEVKKEQEVKKEDLIPQEPIIVPQPAPEIKVGDIIENAVG